jgi:hypothetical protein
VKAATERKVDEKLKKKMKPSLCWGGWLLLLFLTVGKVSGWRDEAGLEGGFVGDRSGVPVWLVCPDVTGSRGGRAQERGWERMRREADEMVREMLIV